MTKEYSVYTLALFAGLCSATISYFSPFFPYGVDSASYLEQARSFMARGVFEITPFGTELTDVVSVPDALFPPGYPLLIVFSSVIFQLPVEVTAPFLSLAALALLPLTIVCCFQRVLGLYPALSIAILVALTPTAVRHGYIAYSDTLSLLLVIFAVNRLLFAGNKSTSWFCLGLLSGFSYLIRNANLALLISMSLFLIWDILVDSQNRRQKINQSLIWASGNALLLAPWLMRNFLVFGKFQPYSMPPSTVSLGENIHDYIKAQLDTVLTLNELDGLIANNVSGILLLITVVVVLLYQVISSWKKWSKIEQQTFFIAVSYVVIGTAMVIAARTKYQWGVHISDRHVLAFPCFIFVAIAIVLKNSSCTIMTRYLLPCLVITLLLARGYQLSKLYQLEAYDQNISHTAQQITANADVICTDLNGRLAFSNRAFVYRILCAAPARHIYPSFQQNKFIDESLQTWANLGAKKGVVVSLFPDKGASDLPLKQEEINKLNTLGWQVERNNKENLILSHKTTAL
ncbi:MAG: glycosyltransferase family 39 protein [Methylococcaceae bacterium]|nr:glycosyltransferase family 39 protein [Methylococcaceae bacterium]